MLVRNDASLDVEEKQHCYAWGGNMDYSLPFASVTKACLKVSIEEDD